MEVYLVIAPQLTDTRPSLGTRTSRFHSSQGLVLHRGVQELNCAFPRPVMLAVKT